MGLIEIFQNVPDPIWAWGPAFFILVGLFIIVRLAMKSFSVLASTAITEFVAAQKKQAEAMSSQASAMSRLAVCIETQANQRHFEHDRVMVSLGLLHDDVACFAGELEKIEETLRGERHV